LNLTFKGSLPPNLQIYSQRVFNRLTHRDPNIITHPQMITWQNIHHYLLSIIPIQGGLLMKCIILTGTIPRLRLTHGH
jgi:hypothetical protein